MVNRNIALSNNREVAEVEVYDSDGRLVAVRGFETHNAAADYATVVNSTDRFQALVWEV